MPVVSSRQAFIHPIPTTAMRVALVSVGDELLAGETVNTNAAWLGRELRDRGVTVGRITSIPDDVATIARVVNELHAEFDAVIVTGGLGPTHDDMTVEGVAAAFGRAVEPHEQALEWIEQHGDYAAADLAEGTAELPAGARQLPNRVGVAPGFVVENCYVLPGVPDEMQGMFADVADEFVGDRTFVEFVEIAEPESALLDRIERLRSDFQVSIGSYPGENVRIRIEAEDEAVVNDAASWLKERVQVPEDR